MGSITVEVRPTRHFTRRFTERLGDLVPEVNPTIKFRVSGVLVETRNPDWCYLDVGGVGRLVLKRHGNGFLGITILPQLHCHGFLPHTPELLSGRAEVESG